MFASLPDKPDHPALEQEILAWWEEERIFDRLREQNRGGLRWSFIDGPITANNPMGIHHAWGRTLKDLFQRYKAMRGHELRYQTRDSVEARDRGVRARGVHPAVQGTGRALRRADD